MKRARLAVAALIAGVALSACGQTSPESTEDGPPVKVVSPSNESGFKGLQLGTPQPRPSFTLADTKGKSYDFFARTKGKPTLLYFGYTHCPDICPTTMATIATALRSLPADVRDRVAVVFVTTDPKRDTGPVLADYLGKFDGDLTTKFVGLTGKLATVEKAQELTGVPVAEDEGQTHSTLVMLFDHTDSATIAFPSGTTPDDMAHDIQRVVGG